MVADSDARRDELSSVEVDLEVDLWVDLCAGCPICGGDTLIAPDCPDGHGGDCPDRLCVACGTALFVDPPALGARRTA